MKRILTVAVAAIIMICSVSCKSADIDLTKKKNIYDDFAAMITTPDEYSGKTISVSSEHTVVYNFKENKIVRHVLRAFNESGEKRALYEIKKEDGKYPAVGALVTVSGVVSSEKFISVTEFKGKSIEDLNVNIDTLTLSTEELGNFIKEFTSKYSASESYEKSIRIFGHCMYQKEKIYAYLTGLDESGNITWNIELYAPDENIDIPEIKDQVTNPVEVIGKLTIYVEDDITYACIQVDKLTSVECTLT